MKNIKKIAEAIMAKGEQVFDPHGGPTYQYKCWIYVSCCNYVGYHFNGKTQYLKLES